MKSAGSNANDTDTKSSVHESLVQEAPLVSGHSAVLAGLTVKDQVGCQDGTTDDGTAIQQLLGEVTGSSRVGLLHVGTAEGILKGLAGLGKEGGRSSRGLCSLRGLDRGVVDEASGVG